MVLVFGSNAFNYFYCYIYLDDRMMQWRVAMISIALVMFVLSLYVWITESLKFNKLRQVVSGWLTIYIFFNLVGVLIGYNLHTKGFMVILSMTAFLGICHVITAKWLR